MSVMLLSSEATNLLAASIVFVGIFVGVAVSYLGMWYAPRITGLIGEEELRVITKLMSIIVLAIAVQFIISGIAEIVRPL